MSMNSTPGHTSSSSFDSLYDPAFAAEISSKMHVPDKICVVEGAERPEIYMSRMEDVKSRMNVPERIVIAGDNQHIAMRESLPELKFDAPLPFQVPEYVLAPPPDVLTVDEFPSVEQKTKTVPKRNVVLDQSMAGMNDLNESSIASANPEEDVALLRRQLRHLSRRVLAIEQDNQQRQQREIIMYTLGLAYFFIKGLFWMKRNL